MKRWQFITLIVLSLACLVLSISAVVSGWANQGLQGQLQAQQVEINKGNRSQQVGSNLVRDIASRAPKNEKLKSLLARNGFTLNENPSPSPAPSPAPPARR